MKRIISFLFIYLTIFLFSINVVIAHEWVSIGKGSPSKVSIELISSDIKSSVLQLELGGFYKTGNEQDGYSISSPETSPFLQEGAPNLGKIACSVIIPDIGAMQIEVLSSSFKDFENYNVTPSKGNLTRNINPADIPFIKGKEYLQNEFWPSSVASLNDPYIIRDYRGESIVFNPFQYNPITKTLRVYSNITVKISRKDGVAGVNQFLRKKPLEKIDPEFFAIYKNHFKNFNSVQYTPLGEQGDLLIICPSQWMSLMQPFVEWKTKKGIHTELIDVFNAGGYNATAIESFIANYYFNSNLTYVLLVGDITQIPSLVTGAGVSDPVYGFILGSDAYSEVFIGRFSADSPDDVTTQVQRSINYELAADTSQNGYGKGVVIGSNQGPGDDFEMDWEHAHNMQTDLIGFNYSHVDELYDGTHLGTNDAPGDPTDLDLLAPMQAGTGVITYTGHGTSTSLTTTGFSNADLGSLILQNNLPFIWSVACINGDFAQNSGPCLAEVLLRSRSNGNPVGAVASFMSSINQTWDPPMDAQDEMIDILTQQDTNNIKRTFAGLSFNGCFHMNDQYGNNGSEMTSTWHVFGDPTLEVRTSTPSELIVFHPDSINLGSTYLAVNCNFDNATVCLTLNGEIISIGKVLNGTVVLFFKQLNVVDTIFVTVTAPNKIPYLGTILIVPTNLPYITYTSLVNHDFNGNNDGLLDYSELVSMDVTLSNLSTVDALKCTAKISSLDTNVVIFSSVKNWGDINGNSSVKVDSAFTFRINNNVADQHIVKFKVDVVDTNSTNAWSSVIYQTINAPNLGITSMIVNDSIGGNNNKKLESGETADLIFHCVNSGYSEARGTNTILSTPNSFLTLNANTHGLGVLAKQSSRDISFNVTMAQNVAVGTPYNVKLKLWSGQYDTIQVFNSTAGDIIEDFETGDYKKFNWSRVGHTVWGMANFLPYQGSYSAVSGAISNGEETDLNITLNVQQNDSITFWYKVSSEPTWDFFKFLIDSNQFGEWSGSIPWSYVSFPVEAGVHIYTFRYKKDLINSYGNDCVWLDNIRLPFNSTIIGIENINFKNELSLYPNPANSNFNVDVYVKEKRSAKASVIDINGKQLITKVFNQLSIGFNKLNINVNDLSNGMYFVKLESDNQMQTYKLNVIR